MLCSKVSIRPSKAGTPPPDASTLNTSIEAMGFLYQFKEGVCKRRWFVLRTGMLYKYHYPKVLGSLPLRRCNV